jgi:uncharacterized protein (DUF2141 family)
MRSSFLLLLLLLLPRLSSANDHVRCQAYDKDLRRQQGQITFELSDKRADWLIFDGKSEVVKYQSEDLAFLGRFKDGHGQIKRDVLASSGRSGDLLITASDSRQGQLQLRGPVFSSAASVSVRASFLLDPGNYGQLLYTDGNGQRSSVLVFCEHGPRRRSPAAASSRED